MVKLGVIIIELQFRIIWTLNEMENYRCDVQLGFESANYPNIEELLGIWSRWWDFLGY